MNKNVYDEFLKNKWGVGCSVRCDPCRFMGERCCWICIYGKIKMFDDEYGVLRTCDYGRDTVCKGCDNMYRLLCIPYFWGSF